MLTTHPIIYFALLGGSLKPCTHLLLLRTPPPSLDLVSTATNTSTSSPQPPSGGRPRPPSIRRCTDRLKGPARLKHRWLKHTSLCECVCVCVRADGWFSRLRVVEEDDLGSPAASWKRTGQVGPEQWWANPD